MSGKQKPEKPESPILAAAGLLEHTLERYEALVIEAERTPLSTRKGIERAARATQEAAQIGEEMGRLVSALAEAIGAMSSRQSTRSQALLERSREIKKRNDEMLALSIRFDALAMETVKINAEVQSFAKMEATTDHAKAQFLRGVLSPMLPVIEGARELARAAADADFLEIEKQADALAQTLLAAKNKVELAAKRLES